MVDSVAVGIQMVAPVVLVGCLGVVVVDRIDYSEAGEQNDAEMKCSQEAEEEDYPY